MIYSNIFWQDYKLCVVEGGQEYQIAGHINHNCGLYNPTEAKKYAGETIYD